MLNVESIRADFPILAREVNGHPLVYLDNGATTQVPINVLEQVDEHYRLHNANVHRGMHTLAHESTEALEMTRHVISRFVGAQGDECVVFTRGATDSINMIARGIEHEIRADDVIVCTALEHHSNFVPWQQLALRTGAHFEVVGLTSSGDVDLEGLARVLEGPNSVRIVAMTCCSNVLGTVTPAKQVALMAHERGALCVLDGAQAPRHGLGRLDETDADFVALSGHKMCAGTGAGILAGSPEALGRLTPRDFGGEMVDEVSIERTTWADIPLRFEAGTPNYVGAIAMGAAAKYLEELGCHEVAQREDALVSYAKEALSTVEGLRILGNPARRSGCVSFTVDDVHPLDLCAFVDTLGIALRSGHNCAQPLLRLYGLKSIARLSPAFYNTEAEIDRAVAAIERASDMLRRVKKRSK